MLNSDNSKIDSNVSDYKEIDFREPVVLTEEARKRIIDELGFLPTEDIINTKNNIITPSGPRLIIKLFTVKKEVIKDDDGNTYSGSFFIKKDGTKSNILMPQAYENHDLYTSCVGLVVAMNRCCYQDEKFRLSGPYCRLGDWVVIPRNEGSLLYLKGQPVYTIYDDRVLDVIEDPLTIRRD